MIFIDVKSINLENIKMRYINYNGKTFEIPEEMSEEEAIKKIKLWMQRIEEIRIKEEENEEQMIQYEKERARDLREEYSPFINEHFQKGKKMKILEKNLARKTIYYYHNTVKPIYSGIENKKWFNDRNFDMRYILTIKVHSRIETENVEKRMKQVISSIKDGELDNLPYNCIYIEILFELDYLEQSIYKFSNKILDELNFYFSGKQFKFI